MRTIFTELKPGRSGLEVIRDWLPELAERLGRSETELVRMGLSAHDFPVSGHVVIKVDTGMEYRINHAFVFIRPEANEAVVFSEHDGYLEFSLGLETLIEEVSVKQYFHEPEEG